MSNAPAVRLADVTKRFGEVIAVDTIQLAIADGEFFSMLGPSGCGKTTTLRMIAGFEQPSEGEIYIMGQPVAGIPAYRRPVNTVFQSYALFPHMTVRQNVAFGLEMAKVPKADIGRRVDEALAMVKMAKLGERKPRQLSGGQQQRVALARALVNRPKVLLLDEPLGALDLKLRKEMQLELKQIQQEVGITFIYVTHDQEEAMTMSDRIAVMSDGLVQQVGTPRQIYEHPTNRFVADFIGETNFVEGKVQSIDRVVTIDVAGVPMQGMADGHAVTIGQPVTLALRPEKLNLYPTGQVDLARSGLDVVDMAGQADNLVDGKLDVYDIISKEQDAVVLKGDISEAVYIGTDTRYRVHLPGGASVYVRMQNFGSRYDAPFAVGDSVYVHWAVENAQVLTE